MCRILLLLFVLTLVQRKCYSARILGVIPTPSYSHQVVYRPLWKELAKRGHEVIVITTDPENDNTTNVKEIDVSFAYDLWTKKYNIMKSVEENRYNPFKVFSLVIEATLDICKQELLHPDVQTLLRNETEHFDLVIVEFLFPPMFGFAERFKCPFIGVLSFDFPSAYHYLLGNAVHPVAYPDVALPFEGTLNFGERLLSSVFSVVIYYVFIRRDTAAEQQLMETHFGKGLPKLYDITKNASMLFSGADPISNVRPLGPAFVFFGGNTHLEPLKALPKDLQQYLDKAKDGAIYFSFGTNVKSDMVPPELRKTMLDAFRELPYKVLWKFDVTDIPDVPENVKIVNWLPQQDVLRHPNVKLFVTQGGVQSLEEALFSNVPLVGIPFVGDQDTNIKKMARRGLGVHLDKTTLTKESFKEAILEVINNPKYKQKAIEIAELSKDQPMTGLEKAVWWTEYVIRHKGAPHLRNPIIDLPFYQYYLLDVIGTVVAIIVVLLYITYKLLAFIKNLIFRPSSSKKIKQQ